jgi:hypothetical protein
MNPTRTLLVTLTAGGLLVGAAAAAGLISAGSASAAGAAPAASSPAPSPSRTPAPGEPGPGRADRHGGPGGLGRGLGGIPRGLGQGPVLHGEFVTGGQNGATRTVVVQTGTVSAKNGSTITVTSSDGYKVDWVLNDSTKVRTGWSQGAVKDIAQGDTVRVQGTRSSSTTTADLVAERPKAGANPTPPASGSSGSGSSTGGSPSGA